MPLPETVHVKLSSEDAQAITLTPVVVRDIPIRELLDWMIRAVGKDAARIHELLLRGSMISGASRFRWTGWDADRAALETLLATFPDADPARPFAAVRTTCAILRGPSSRIEIERTAGAARRFFRRTSFWDGLMEIAAGGAPRYVEYSYERRADCYRLALDGAAAARVHALAEALKYPSLAVRIRAAALDAVDFYVARDS